MIGIKGLKPYVRVEKPQYVCVEYGALLIEGAWVATVVHAVLDDSGKEIDRIVDTYSGADYNQWAKAVMNNFTILSKLFAFKHKLTQPIPLSLEADFINKINKINVDAVVDNIQGEIK